MARVLVVANQKGGVTKTTTATQFGHYLAAAGNRVLLVDTDPQGNATTAAGIIPNADQPTIEVMFRDPRVPLSKIIVPGSTPGLDVLPSDLRLSTVELEAALGRLRIKLNTLKAKLAEVADHYAYIIIDTPPSLGAFTLNAVVAAERMVVPIDGGNPFALQGFTILYNQLRDFCDSYNKAFRPIGFFRAKWDSTKLSQEMWELLQHKYPHLAMNSVIPVNVKVAEAMSHGQLVMEYDAKAKGATALLDLTAEILERWDKARWVPAGQ